MTIATRLAVCTALVAAVLPAPFSGAEQPGSATISGSVTLTAMRFSAMAASPYARRGVPPKRTTNWPEIRNVIVYVDEVRAASAAAPVTARISQRDEEFIPRVTAVTVGSTVEFPNDDPFFHNVFSLSKARSFDLGRYPSGTSKSVTFDPGLHLARRLSHAARLCGVSLGRSVRDVGDVSEEDLLTLMVPSRHLRHPRHLS